MPQVPGWAGDQDGKEAERQGGPHRDEHEYGQDEAYGEGDDGEEPWPAATQPSGRAGSSRMDERKADEEEEEEEEGSEEGEEWARTGGRGGQGWGGPSAGRPGTAVPRSRGAPAPGPLPSASWATGTGTGTGAMGMGASAATGAGISRKGHAAASRYENTRSSSRPRRRSRQQQQQRHVRGRGQQVPRVAPRGSIPRPSSRRRKVGRGRSQQAAGRLHGDWREHGARGQAPLTGSAEAVRREIQAAAAATVPGVTHGDPAATRARLEAGRTNQGLRALRAARESAVRRHRATVRALEATQRKQARARAMAARQQRRAEAVRARRFVEDLARRSVGAQLARASKRDAVAAALVRAVAREERAAALDALRARAARAGAAAQAEQQALERQRHAAVTSLELEEEEARRNAESRFAAAVGLAAAIRGEARAVREA